MKQFKVGERVAFTYNGARIRGEIYYIYEKHLDIKRTERHIYGVQLDEANIKRLVKKKRRVIWVNLYNSGYHLAHDLKEKLKYTGDGFIRTAKFRENK